MDLNFISGPKNCNIFPRSDDRARKSAVFDVKNKEECVKACKTKANCRNPFFENGKCYVLIA